MRIVSTRLRYLTLQNVTKEGVIMKSLGLADVSIVSCGTLSLDGLGYLDTYMAEHPEDFLTVPLGW